MKKIAIFGLGRIGSLIAYLLSNTGNYQVVLIDKNFLGHDISRLRSKYGQLEAIEIDVKSRQQLQDLFAAQSFHAVVSSLPYFCNSNIAEMAKIFQCHYFDLTEDIEVTQFIQKLANHADTAFVPQCGLAPGFISIITNHLTQHFDKLDAVKMRVGALPTHANNALHYALTWSTDGLINEYGNPCHSIEDGIEIIIPPLENLELIEIDGVAYEAFNTSGGLGSLIDNYRGKVNTLNYKTIRYPGHCAQMHLLMNDLKLNADRPTLKRILENAIPKTYQDVVIVYVAVTGWQNNEFIEENYVNKIYPETIADFTWSAIQISTASSLCAVMDIVLASPNQYRGFIRQEQFVLDNFLENQYGKYFKKARN